MDIEAEAERPAEPELKKKRFEIEIEGEKLELVHLLLEQRKAARDLEKLEERELITQPKSLLRVSERNEYYLGGGNGMYIYTVQAMPGQKAKFEGDTSIKYRVKRLDDSIPTSKKGRTEIIRDNLEYDEAMELIKGFNSMEGKSQNMRDEAARQKNAL